MGTSGAVGSVSGVGLRLAGGAGVGEAPGAERRIPRPLDPNRGSRCRVGAAEGASEHGSERSYRCVSDARSEQRTPAPAMQRARLCAPRYSIRRVAATILIVEDEYAVARGIQYALQQEGYDVGVAHSGEEGLEIATKEAPDLVVLDVRLPGIDGFEVLRRIRAAGAKMPILVLTARDDEVDKVIGLELGADDYLTKPYGLRELLSRIKALLRRSYGDLADAAGGRVIRHKDLIIDLERRRVQRGARRISLTPTEFEILRHLASRPGRVYTRGELLELLRDYEALDQDEKTINVHVSHLREKIEDDPATPAFVLTVRGVGYAFAER
jgi:two-component system, OmpR family, response regulator VicR